MPVHFGDVTLDEARRLLLREEQPVHVSPKAFQLLAILVQERPKAVSKEQLQERLWPDTFVTEGNLPSLIAELRAALGDEARNPRYIRTLHGFGYSLVAPAVEGDLPEAAGEPPPTAVRFAPRAAFAALVLIVAAVAVFWLGDSRRAGAEGRAGGTTIRSIAVLPFDTSGLDEIDAHLGLGLADLVITRLSNVGELTVRPTSAIRGFTGRDYDARAVGRMLNVDGVLEGSVRTAGERLRVTVQLLDVNAQKPIWAGHFDEPRSEIFALEDRISSRVADSLLLRLTPEEKHLLTRRYTASPEAYQLYIQGRYQLQNAGAAGPFDAPEQAAKLFTQSVEEDPGYALAWAGLAEARAEMAALGREKPSEYWPQVKVAAQRALELEPGLEEAQIAMAMIRFFWDLDYAGTEHELRQILAQAPRNTRALSVYGYLLQCLGRFDESLSVRRRALELDPLNPAMHWGVANAYLAARRFEPARRKIEELLATNTDHYEGRVGLIRIRLAEGEYGEAIRLARELVASDRRPRGRAILAYALARSGQPEEAREILHDLETISRSRHVARFHLIAIHVALGDHETALQLLEEGLKERDGMVRLKFDPILDPLRDDPRFQSILHRAGF